jgi:subtilisin family serine protease
VIADVIFMTVSLPYLTAPEDQQTPVSMLADHRPGSRAVP